MTPSDRSIAAPPHSRRVPMQRIRGRSAGFRPVEPRPAAESEPAWVGQLMGPTRTRVVVPATAAIDRVETLSARWRDRRALAVALRIAIFCVPLVASVLAALAVALVVPRPSGVLPVIAWWGLLVVAGMVAMLLVDRVGRRLLPLAALLRLSLVFPDHAPSRFAVAARAGSVRNLERHLSDARAAGRHDDEPARVAEQIITLVGALAMHDRRTRGHSERVRAFTDLLSDELKLAPMDRERLRWAALLHDVGKLDVAPALLNKPGAPTDSEWQELRAHPVRGAELVGPLLPWLGEWSSTIAQHHERWDGHGYPFGLEGQDIALGARIVAVADAFEVMTAPRPYRRPVTAEAAREELAACAGQHFDPVVVRAFLSISIGHLRKAMGPLSWAAQLPFIGMLPRAEALLGVFGRDTASAAATAAVGAGVVAVGALGPSATPVAIADAPDGREGGISRYVDVDDESATLAGSSRSAPTGPRWQIGPHGDRAATTASSSQSLAARPAARGQASSTSVAAAAAKPRAAVQEPKPATPPKPAPASAPAAAPRTAIGATGTVTPTGSATLPTAKRRAEAVAAVQPAIPAVRTGGRAVPAVAPPAVPGTRDRSAR